MRAKCRAVIERDTDEEHGQTPTQRAEHALVAVSAYDEYFTPRYNTYIGTIDA